jgi:hypothetical protein
MWAFSCERVFTLLPWLCCVSRLTGAQCRAAASVQRLSGGQAQVPQDALDIDITLIAKLQFALCASDGAGKPPRPYGEGTK